MDRNEEKHAHAPSSSGTSAGLFDLFRLVDFDLPAALHYAEIRAALEASGRPIGPMDLLVAAQARRLDAALVTGNSGEFKRVKGLKVFDWN